jgi:hypothetical protein
LSPTRDNPRPPGAHLSTRGPAEPSRIQGEIATVRSELGQVIAELDRRRRQALDLRRQVSRYALPLSLVALGAGAWAGGALLRMVYRHRQRKRLSVRLQSFRRAIGRAVRTPDRVAQPDPRLALRLLTAISGAAAGSLVRALVQQTLLPAKGNAPSVATSIRN